MSYGKQERRALARKKAGKQARPTYGHTDGSAWRLVAGDAATGKGIVLQKLFENVYPVTRRPTPLTFKRDYTLISGAGQR